jgi:peptidoglycan L-alanyl-D-glutamate endopeptidase CwlK
VTNATGKTSMHCKRRAFDYAFIGKDPYPAKFDWKKIGVLGEKLGLSWGGRWKSFRDNLHFEL